MKHYFYTKIGLDFRRGYSEKQVNNCSYEEMWEEDLCEQAKVRLGSPRLDSFNSASERIASDINFWLDHGSKFYERQTVDREFEVLLGYDKIHEEIVKSFSYPDYVKLCGPIGHGDGFVNQLSNRALVEKFLSSQGKPMSIHMIDADDWFRDDFIEFMESEDWSQTKQGLFNYHHSGLVDHPFDKKQYSLVTHNWYRKYDLVSNQYSEPIRDPAGYFASCVYNSFNIELPMIYNHGNEVSAGMKNQDVLPPEDMSAAHYRLNLHDHHAHEEVLYITSIGQNLANEWIDVNGRPVEKNLDQEDLNKFYKI